MSMSAIKVTAGVEAAKAAPPVTVATLATAQDWSMGDAVAIATIAYIVLQAAYLLWKWYRESKS